MKLSGSAIIFSAILFLGELIPGMSIAQNQGHTASGQVFDSETGEKVPYATVFLANTLVGDRADSTGQFHLNNIPTGKYDLTVSCVGYALAVTSIEITHTVTGLQIRIKPHTTVLKEVIVKFNKSKERKERRKREQMFRTSFLGNTRNAAKCKIINIEDVELDYDRDNGVLTASSDVPIEVENRALGYRILFLLTKFRIDYSSNIILLGGIARFEPLDTSVRHNDFKLSGERDRAYYGSLNHFMRSLKANALPENNFELYNYRLPINRSTGKPITSGRYNYYYLDSRDLRYIRPDSLLQLKIIYKGETPETNFGHKRYRYGTPQTSYFKYLKHSLVIHENGYFEKPFDFLVQGYMGWCDKVIADLVPMEYTPVLSVKQRRTMEKLIVQDSLSRERMKELQEE